MSKTKICDIVKSESDFTQSEDFIKLIRKGKHVCKKCGHVAKKKEYLCKPVKIKKK